MRKESRERPDQRREQICSLVSTLNFAGVKVRDFENSLRYLPGPGGPFAPGQRLATLNSELYETLFEDEKSKLAEYYLHEVGYAEQDYPDLATQFPKVFR